MVLSTMRVTYAKIVSVTDEFDVDPNFTPEYDFTDSAAGGWAPPAHAPPPDPQADAHAAKRAKASRAREPWYVRNRAVQALINPLLLPAPMRLY